ncbi:hypothetical protein [Paracoccus sp. JM45]|uniref:hypothetical protein n=1 Tax=Paracoccus sp. JM45 TaxID=2283626 RepID=UPI000E6C279C|nr:hypothetical protein [Paracoccus sp. JM45]RJE81296.1 hypothetical protein DWB67_01165 [Paracoccus sp. JM45]
MTAKRPLQAGAVRRMLATRSVEQVADDLRVDPAEIEAMASGGKGVVLRCNDTGREWRLSGWRGAYRRVCLLGLTDWDWRLDRRGQRDGLGSTYATLPRVRRAGRGCEPRFVVRRFGGMLATSCPSRSK